MVLSMFIHPDYFFIICTDVIDYDENVNLHLMIPFPVFLYTYSSRKFTKFRLALCALSLCLSWGSALCMISHGPTVDMQHFSPQFRCLYSRGNNSSYIEAEYIALANHSPEINAINGHFEYCTLILNSLQLDLLHSLILSGCSIALSFKSF